MKKYAFIFILGSMIAWTATSCQDKEHTGGDNTDTVSTMPAETPQATPMHQDTVAVPPADPAMDTGARQSPKM